MVYIPDVDYEKIGIMARDYFGFTGIGVYPNRVHLDVRDGTNLKYGFSVSNLIFGC